MQNHGCVPIVLNRVLGACSGRKLKFLIAGGVNTVFGYSVYAAFVFFNAPVSLSLLMATVLGVVFNYFSFGCIVFRGVVGALIFIKFVAAYVAVYSINAIALEVLTKGLHFGPYVAQIICVVPSVMVSWLLMNYWVYDGGRRDEEESN